jgi:hypothetical protein
MPKVDRQPTRDERAQEAFEAYTFAKAQADRSLLLRDMAAAVHAWNAFVDLGFETGAAREDLLV